jgi:hypothetical protein
MVLDSTEPLTEMSTGNLHWGGGKARLIVMANVLTVMCEPIV